MSMRFLEQKRCKVGGICVTKLEIDPRLPRFAVTVTGVGHNYYITRDLT